MKNHPNDTFTPPLTMEEAQRRRLDANRGIIQIQSQLSFPERRNRDGSPMSAAEYKAWRAKALRKLSECEVELLHVKNWIRSRRTALNSGAAPEDAEEHIGLLLAARRVLVANHDKLDAEAGKLSDAIDSYLQHRG